MQSNRNLATWDSFVSTLEMFEIPNARPPSLALLVRQKVKSEAPTSHSYRAVCCLKCDKEHSSELEKLNNWAARCRAAMAKLIWREIDHASQWSITLFSLLRTFSFSFVCAHERARVVQQNTLLLTDGSRQNARRVSENELTLGMRNRTSLKYFFPSSYFILRTMTFRIFYFRFCQCLLLRRRRTRHTQQSAWISHTKIDSSQRV